MKNLSKRELIIAGCATIFLSAYMGKKNSFENDLKNLELQNGGRLGVCILNTKTGETWGHRINERFGMCSTFKFALAAIMLKEIELGKTNFDKEITIQKNGLKPYNDYVENAVKTGKISIKKAIEAIQINSDNICANGLLNYLGGPMIMTQKLRELGDNITRLDRIEPEMNLVSGNGIQDTTTPLAFANTMQKILLGDYLNKQSRKFLLDMMIATKTGSRRLRAGLPNDWVAGDKTGTGLYDVQEKIANKYNDVAIVLPPKKPPFIITSYYEADGSYNEMRQKDQKVLADVGRIAHKIITK